MKKMYWILLLACGALAFPACSDDDNTPGGKDPDLEPEVPEVVYKQVKTITEVDGDFDENDNLIDVVSTLKYNEKGKLSEAFDEDFTNDDGIKYTYTDTKVTKSKDSYTENGAIIYPASTEWMLKSGMAETLKFTSRTNAFEGVTEKPTYINSILTYDADGYLSTVQTDYTDSVTSPKSSETFTFTTGNLTKYVYMAGDRSAEFDEYVYTMTPGTFENKANIDWFYYLECFENDEIKDAFMLGLAGKRSAKLPSSITLVNSYLEKGDKVATVETIDYTFSYLADKDGNVTQITINEDGEESAVYKIGY